MEAIHRSYSPAPDVMVCFVGSATSWHDRASLFLWQKFLAMKGGLETRTHDLRRLYPLA